MREDINVHIHAKFGSRLQEEAAIGALRVMLEGWMKFFNSKNKRNRITVMGIPSLDKKD